LLFFFRLVDPFDDVVEAEDAWMMYGVGFVMIVGLK
jgi:hypothetical protein